MGKTHFLEEQSANKYSFGRANAKDVPIGPRKNCGPLFMYAESQDWESGCVSGFVQAGLKLAGNSFAFPNPVCDFEFGTLAARPSPQIRASLAPQMRATHGKQLRTSQGTEAILSPS